MKTLFQLCPPILLSLSLLVPHAITNAQNETKTEVRTTPQSLTVETAPAKVNSLIKIDEKIGTGAEATPGLQVEVQYTGWLYDPKAPDRHGIKFDSSYDRKTPLKFQLDARQVIRGWDLGVRGMRVG